MQRSRRRGTDSSIDSEEARSTALARTETLLRFACKQDRHNVVLLHALEGQFIETESD